MIAGYHKKFNSKNQTNDNNSLNNNKNILNNKNNTNNNNNNNINKNHVDFKMSKPNPSYNKPNHGFNRQQYRGPAPSFNNYNNSHNNHFKHRRERYNQKSPQERIINPNQQELISFLSEKWASVQKEIETGKSENGDECKVVYFQADENDPVVKDFVPFDLEAYWGQRVFENITNSP